VPPRAPKGRHSLSLGQLGQLIPGRPRRVASAQLKAGSAAARGVYPGLTQCRPFRG